jgi:glutathione S-transferase
MTTVNPTTTNATTTNPTTSTDGVFRLWLDGHLPPHRALRTLWDDLRQIEATRQEVEARRSAVRDQLRQITEHLGGKTSLRGYGKLEVLADSVTVSYDKAQVDALIIALTNDHPAIAAQLAACRTKRPRAGGLRVTSEK